jgi:type IV secretion system protein VirD4
MHNQTRRPEALLDHLAKDGWFTRPVPLFLGAGLVTALFLTITDGAFLEGSITWNVPYFMDTTRLRVSMMIVAGLLGFSLGWLIAGRNPLLKSLLAGVLAGFVVFLAIVDQGSLGWGSASLGALLLFVAGAGYWLRQAYRYLTARPTTLGSAEWATVPYMVEHDIVGEAGFRLGHTTYNGETIPLHYAGDRHLLLSAANRSGKGTTVLIPNLLTYQGSVLTIDPKGENAMMTAGRRAAMGQDVHVVDPWGITGLGVARFNPLDWLIDAGADLTENAMLLADALIVPMGKEDQFWTEEAKALMQGVIVHVATAEEEKGNRTLSRVRDILLLDGDGLKAVFTTMLDSPHHVVRSTGARCLQKEEKLLANVLASAQAQTHFLDSARIRESLAVSDFKFEDLKARPMTVYLVLPADRLNAFGRWLRLLIQQALTVSARNIALRPAKPVLFLLDELPALGRLSMVEQAFGLMAGFGMQLWGVVQDLSQLKRIYGDGWETFISNAGVVQYFGSRDRMSAEYFSALCGVTTVWNLSTAIARAFGTSTGGSSESTTSTDTSSATQRKLAYADELMRLPKDKQLLLIENLNPVSCSRTPWFEDEALKSLGVNLRDSETAEADHG